MPRNNILGICLQTLAGLIFIIEQIWKRVIKRDHLAKLQALLDKPAFQQKVPLLAIPIISPILLIIYFKISGTNLKWYEAFFSIAMAVSFANFFYLFFINVLTRLLENISSIRNKIAKYALSNSSLSANLVLFIVSTIALVVAIIALYPLSKLQLGNTLLFSLVWALFITTLMIVVYGLSLSVLYFILYGLLKLGFLFRRIRIRLTDSDSIFISRIIWVFLILSWLWGGILLFVDALSK
jgi:hypothetical protein